jgi:CheY-like chemotaxis protein
VAISGYGYERDRQRAIQAGFDRHLVKPFHSEALRRLLNEFQLVDEQAAPTD